MRGERGASGPGSRRTAWTNQGVLRARRGFRRRPPVAAADGGTESPSRAIEPPPSHPHVLARRCPTRSNGPSASVPPFMMVADHESEGLGVRSSSVGYCAFPTEKATLKIGGWMWIEVWAYADAYAPSRLLVSICHSLALRGNRCQA